MAGPLIGADDGDRHRVDDAVQLDEPVGVVGGERVPGQVGAGAEHRALAGQHDGADVSAGGLLDRLPQLVDELGVQRIAPLGPLQLDGHNGFVSGDTDHGGQDI